MPDYRDQDPTAQASKSPLSSLMRWLQIKKYQYEVTFSLYMLTSTEKCVFNVIILVLFTLLIAAAVAYLPNHVIVISNRLWYYVHGEFLFSSAAGASSSSVLQQSPLPVGATAARSGSVLKGVVSATLDGVARHAGEL